MFQRPGQSTYEFVLRKASISHDDFEMEDLFASIAINNGQIMNERFNLTLQLFHFL